MKLKIVAAVFLALLVVKIRCSEAQEQSNQANVPFYKKEKVEAVFYHHVNNYSVMMRNGDELKTVSFPRAGALEVKLIDDVQRGRDMWYEV
jgi:hypothetical protein